MTSTTRLVLAGTAAALVAAVSLVGGILRDSGEPAHAVAVKVDAASGTFEAGFSADTETFVRQLTADLRESPKNARGYTLLGLAYQQRARETGNPVFYSKSEQALRRRPSSSRRTPRRRARSGRSPSRVTNSARLIRSGARRCGSRRTRPATTACSATH